MKLNEMKPQSNKSTQIISSYDPKFSDRQTWANSVDPDQTAPDQGLH